jgi:phosphoribosylformylglycinamidine cyclo-ligase
MATYNESGVNIFAGDEASRIAYSAAIETFASRSGMIGEATKMPGGFSGALDFGAFYLVMNCDGVGTKIDLALETGDFSGMGHDLLAMVADDSVCTGAETVSITNTIDTNRVLPEEVAKMMESLKNACIQEKVNIIGGEIAELGNTLSKTIWNATAIGIVAKDRFITGEDIFPGDCVIALEERGFRSNGFSLVRYILKENNVALGDFFSEGISYGKALLTPSTLYSAAMLSIIGRYDQTAKVHIKGIAHITGGGLAGNFSRILKKKKLGADLPNIFPMPLIMKRLQELGQVEDREAYRTWNGGNGMLVVVAKEDSEKTLSLLKEQGITAKIAGEITDTSKILHRNYGVFAKREEMMEWKEN